MKRLLLALIFPYSLIAQNQSFYAGGRSASLAHSTVALSDVWSSCHNQAGLAFLEQNEIGISYQNKYFLKELMVGNIAFAIPLKNGTLATGLEYFGFELFNRTKLGLSYAHRFGPYFSSSVTINYEHFYVSQGSNNGGVATFEAGVFYKPLKSLNLGLHFYNPTNQSFNNESGDKLPVIVRFGAQKSLGSKSMVTAEVRKQADLEERYSLGAEYRFLERVALRTGISIQPISNTWGLGFNFSSFQVDLSYEYAVILGNSGSLSLNYTL